jgi:hypothetical protein
VPATLSFKLYSHLPSSPQPAQNILSSIFPSISQNSYKFATAAPSPEPYSRAGSSQFRGAFEWTGMFVILSAISRDVDMGGGGFNWSGRYEVRRSGKTRAPLHETLNTETHVGELCREWTLYPRLKPLIFVKFSPPRVKRKLQDKCTSNFSITKTFGLPA